MQTEFVGVSGQVCSVVYELTGPVPQHFTDHAEAEHALYSPAPHTARPQQASLAVEL